MRARPLALLIAGFLASTSAVGIALYNSQQQRLAEDTQPEANTGFNLNAADTATLEASSGAAVDPLQVDESLLFEDQKFDTTHGAGVSIPNITLASLQPVSTGTTSRAPSADASHVEAGSATDSSGGSPGFTNSLQASTLSARLVPTFGGGGGGGGGGRSGSGGAPQTGTDVVDHSTGKGNDHPPKGPETPTNSETPQTPTTPETPRTPTNPESPTLPETPSVPENPSTPYEPPFVPETPNPNVEAPVSVPEPGTLGLIGVGLVGLLLGRRKSARRA